MAKTSGRARTRQQLSAAALRLFSDQGYESTTVDDITTEAGVARRTYFRYFHTKEDAIFPDHDSTVERVSILLDSSSPNEDPLSVVCRGIREVLRMYIADPQVSIARYRLLRQVPALREREIAVVSRYERLFTNFLLAHPASAARTHSALLAEVSAAAVVAAHNHVLRVWLRADGQGDPESHLDEALEQVRRHFATRPEPTEHGDVVVTVAPAGSSVEEVVKAVRTALGLTGRFADARDRRSARCSSLP